MDHPRIIQGGMGVAISNWKLANAVSSAGHLGVVSGTGISPVLTARLMQGDPGGHMRRALEHFPFQEPVKDLLDKYYVPGGIAEDKPYKVQTMWTVNPSQSLNVMTVIANFVEVFLAKEGHNNPVGINLLEKIQLPNISSLYGAMLAGVDYVIIGAGIPMQIPGVLDRLAEHLPVSYRLDVEEASKEEEFKVHFKPEEVFSGVKEKLGNLVRPFFLPIVSSVVLAKALKTKATGEINGFVIETPIAGGHNAPPRGKVELNERGEPIYGERDKVDLEKIKEMGLPFWLAGGYGHPHKVREAIKAGAQGVQVGTAFAYSDESGMMDRLKKVMLRKVLREEADVRTDPVASPTGFPFKVAEIEGSIADPEIYAARNRICDQGFLRHLYKQEDGKIGYRCPSEPIDQYVKKGGTEEDAIGRTCLCNNLFATAGYGQRRANGYVEPYRVTSGDDLVNIGALLKPGKLSYKAQDVIDYLEKGLDD